MEMIHGLYWQTTHADYNPSINYVIPTPDTGCEVAGPCQEHRHSRQNRSAKHCRFNQQEAPRC